jgi:branched-chain amino acid transport system permease protein
MRRSGVATLNEAGQIVISGLLQGSIFAILALGFSLVFQVTGAINLSQGAFFVLAALTMYTLEATLGWPMPAAAVASILATTVVGVLIGAWTFVPALSKLSSISILMLTAGLLTLLEGVVLVVWGSQPYALPAFSGEQPVVIFGIRVATQGLWIIATTAAIILAFWYVLACTGLGRALRACADNPTAARLMGINVPRMTLLSFGMAAMIAAIGGVVVAPITSLQFDTGRLFTISGFIAVAIGGIQSFVGAILGGLALGVIEQLAAAYVSSLFANTLALGLLLVALLWRPNGLFVIGVARRQDVRENPRVHQEVIRVLGRRAWVSAAVALVVVVALPWLPSGGEILPSLVITAILFMAVLGLDVSMGWGGQVNLGQAGFMAVGGYTAAILATRYDLPPVVGTLAGLVLSLICALMLSLVTMRLRGLYLALATLAFGLLVDSLSVGLTEITGGPSGLVGIPSFAIGDWSFDSPLSMYYLVVALDVVAVLMLAGGMRSSFGRALQAIRTDQMAAAALGVNVLGYKLAAFLISAGLASLSGSLYAFFFHFLSPEMLGSPRSLEMVAMLVIGGEGTLVGPVLGVALLTMLPTVFQPLALYKTFASGALLVLSFLYMPQGLYGAVAKQLLKIGRRRSNGSAVRNLAVGGEAP